MPWHGWQSVSASYGAQIGSDRQRCGEMDELRDECDRERGLVDITVTTGGGLFVKVVAEMWMPVGRRVRRTVKWFVRESTALDWAEGVATRWEKEVARDA